MLKHKLEEKKSSSDDMEKQLGLLDLLFEHRLRHIDASAVREEANKCECKYYKPLKHVATEASCFRA